MPVRLAYLVSHPIQYQAPLLRRISAEPGIDLTVYFMNDFSVRSYKDPGFGVDFKWDVPLLEGYKSEFLQPTASESELSYFKPYSRGLKSFLNPSKHDAVWVHGYHQITLIRAILTAKRNGLKVLVRSENQRVTATRPTGIGGAAKELAVKRVLSLIDGALTIGKLNRDYYLSLGVPEGRLFPMPYAVENSRFIAAAEAARPKREEFRAELGLEPGRPIVLFASKFQGRKRPGDLYEAFKGLSGSPKPYLLFVGDGEDRAELQQRAATEGQDSVRFFGFQNQTVLPRFLDLCNVFVLPSFAEPWGLAINEAMCSSKCVIVTDEVGCAPDLVADGVNGRVFPAGDVNALRDCLQDVLSNPGRCEAMGKESLRIISGCDFEADVRGLNAALASVARLAVA
jgi:glycosyltransferase involved in cell wall biosynthesis